MLKVIESSSQTFDQPTASLVSLHSGGVDSVWAEKRASQYLRHFDSFEPKKDHSLIHLIAMGASDVYGPNRNGDAYYKTSKQLDLSDKDWTTLRLANGRTVEKTAENFTDRTDVGLKETYKTFEKNAKVYKHHKNKPHQGDHIYGDVKAAAYNDKMDRVELLIEVPNNEWEDELNKLANDENIPFSMACWLDPKIPVLTASGHCPINMVEVGDLVLTHKGNWKRVIDTRQRTYTGETITVRCKGLHLPLQMTADHPMLVRLSQLHRNKITIETGKEFKAPEISWVKASELQEGDELLYIGPSDFPVDVTPFESPYFAGFLGEAFDDTFLSDQEDAVVDEILGDTVRVVPPALFAASNSCKLAFFGALIDGPNASIDSDLVWVYPDYSVVMQVRDLLYSAGIPSFIYQGKNITDQNNHKVTAFELRVPAEYIYEIFPYSGDLQKANIEEYVKNNATHSPFEDRYVPYEINSIEVSYVTNVNVYNLEVEEDESYTVAGICSHNCKVPYDICSITGHKARNRNEYNTKLASNITQMLENGHISHAVNDHMNFFDISRVNRPADRIAWSLAKAASHEILTGADLANSDEYALYPDIEVLASNEPEKVASRYYEIVKLSTLEKRALNGFAERWAPALQTNKNISFSARTNKEVIGQLDSLHKHSTLLPFNLFIDLLQPNMSDKLQDTIKSASQHLPDLFNIVYQQSIDAVAANDTYEGQELYTNSQTEKIAELAAEHYSFASDKVVKRAIDNSLKNNTVGTVNIKYASNMPTGVELGLLEQYAAYQLSFLEKISSKNPSNALKYKEMLVTFNCIQ